MLLPALTERKVKFTGDIWSGEVDDVGGTPGSRHRRSCSRRWGHGMLRLAGARTAGSILWLTGRTPCGRDQAGGSTPPRPRPAGRLPQIVACVPVCVTSKHADR